jgi:hypothetical protein
VPGHLRSYLARLAIARRPRHIRIMAGSPIDGAARRRLKVNVDRATQMALPARRLARERLQFIRLPLERIVKAGKPAQDGH